MRRFVFPRIPPRHPEYTPLVILNSFQDNEQPSPVILKQVQDDEAEVRGSGFEDHGIMGSCPPSPHRV